MDVRRHNIHRFIALWPSILWKDVWETPCYLENENGMRFVTIGVDLFSMMGGGGGMIGVPGEGARWPRGGRMVWEGSRGGGAYWVCAARETPIFSHEFPFRSISFHKLPKNPFRSITILHFLADFAVPETIIFKISLISTRSTPSTAGSARTAAPRVNGRSGDSHFQAFGSAAG